MTGTARKGKGKLIAGLTLALGVAVIAGPSSSQGAPTFWNPGDIIVADSLDQQIEAVDPVTGSVSHVSTGGNMVFPAGISFADDGDILVIDRNAAAAGEGALIRIDSVTAAQTVVSTNAISVGAGGEERFNEPIAVDRKGNNAYVTDFGNKPSRLTKVNLATGKQTLVSAGKNIGDPLGIDTSLKHALIADAGSKKSNLRLSGGLIDVNLDSGKQTVISTKGDFEDLVDVDVENKHSALVADSGAFNFTGALFRVDLDTGKTKTIFKGGEFVPGALAIASKDEAFISRCCNGGTTAGGIYRVDLKSGDRTPLSLSGFNNPLGLEIAP